MWARQNSQRGASVLPLQVYGTNERGPTELRRVLCRIPWSIRRALPSRDARRLRTVIGLEIGEFFAIGDFVGRTHAVNDEPPVEMVHFVLPDAREQVLAFQLDRFALEILGPDPAAPRATDHHPHVRDREAALL